MKGGERACPGRGGRGLFALDCRLRPPSLLPSSDKPHKTGERERTPHSASQSASRLSHHHPQKLCLLTATELYGFLKRLITANYCRRARERLQYTTRSIEGDMASIDNRRNLLLHRFSMMCLGKNESSAVFWALIGLLL
ncbi:hypothetical protein MHYP_G00030660 [Metynnis hypsauchen]